MQSMVLSRESMSSVYAVVIPVRPLFATSSLVQTASTRSDTIIGTSLRRACGASCIRLGSPQYLRPDPLNSEPSIEHRVDQAVDPL